MDLASAVWPVRPGPPADIAGYVLDRVLPLDGRWPEPRQLWQTAVFYGRDRSCLDLAAATSGDLVLLLRHLREQAETWHAAAACDEDSTTSSAVRWAMRETGVLLIPDLDPGVWLECTLLVRWLASGTGG